MDAEAAALTRKDKYPSRRYRVSSRPPTRASWHTACKRSFQSNSGALWVDLLATCPDPTSEDSDGAGTHGEARWCFGRLGRRRWSGLWSGQILGVLGEI